MSILINCREGVLVAVILVYRPWGDLIQIYIVYGYMHTLIGFLRAEASSLELELEIAHLVSMNPGSVWFAL